MKVFDTVSRRAFALLAAVSCAVCAAVPAAADVVYPVWCEVMWLRVSRRCTAIM